jgi:hypothetical protein
LVVSALKAEFLGDFVPLREYRTDNNISREGAKNARPVTQALVCRQVECPSTQTPTRRGLLYKTKLAPSLTLPILLRIFTRHADVAELADAQVSEACDGDIVEVQVLSSAPILLTQFRKISNRAEELGAAVR